MGGTLQTLHSNNLSRVLCILASLYDWDPSKGLIEVVLSHFECELSE